MGPVFDSRLMHSFVILTNFFLGSLLFCYFFLIHFAISLWMLSAFLDYFLFDSLSFQLSMLAFNPPMTNKSVRLAPSCAKRMFAYVVIKYSI